MAGSILPSRLVRAAPTNDLIIVEGAWAFSTASRQCSLAAFGLPMVLVMDVKGMAQTAAAIALGLANHRNDIRMLGMIANNCGSARHRELIESALPSDLPLWAALPRSDAMALPERHLGLVQAEEVSEALKFVLNTRPTPLPIQRSDLAEHRTG